MRNADANATSTKHSASKQHTRRSTYDNHYVSYSEYHSNKYHIADDWSDIIHSFGRRKYRGPAKASTKFALKEQGTLCHENDKLGGKPLPSIDDWDTWQGKAKLKDGNAVDPYNLVTDIYGSFQQSFNESPFMKHYIVGDEYSPFGVPSLESQEESEPISKCF